MTPQVRILHPLFRKLGLKNGKLPYDRLVTLYTYGILAVIGVKVETEASGASYKSYQTYFGR